MDEAASIATALLVGVVGSVRTLLLLVVRGELLGLPGRLGASKGSMGSWSPGRRGLVVRRLEAVHNVVRDDVSLVGRLLVVGS